MVGQELLRHILHFIDPSLRPFALLTCSYWNLTIRYESKEERREEREGRWEGEEGEEGAEG